MPFVNCPECGMEQHVPRDLIGLLTDCPKCKAEFRVEDDDAPVRRRRNKKGSRRAMLLIGIGLVAVLATGATIWLAGGKSRANNMTYREMYEQLRGRGIDWEYQSCSGGAYLIADKSHAVVLVTQAEADGFPWPDGLVLMSQTPSEEAARQRAGRRLKKTYAYGTWFFYGDEQMLARIRMALE